MKGQTCERCPRLNKRGGRLCGACYQAEYRLQPERRLAHRRGVRAYVRRVPEKRAKWVRTYKERVGVVVPALGDLRRAIKALDTAISTAAQREGVRRTGGEGEHDDTER